ncbi:MAG: hypothetical protein IKN43_14990 [Selenomonadaceae bacterium]|nr:hypothetical protein [Selenomonadaceae bacterium]
MDNQNIIQTIIDKYIALKNEQPNNISYDEIPDLTIVTSYWFMRISSKHYAS